MNKDNIYFLDRQSVTLSDITAEGYILDIGGGGEGIIGQLKGAQVVAIDRSHRELREAPPGGSKIVMDAAGLHFLDNTFNTVTAFFSFMFIPKQKHAKVFREVSRVLRPGGRFLMWDINLVPPFHTEKEYFAFHLDVHLPGRTIQTGYGYHWPESRQDSAFFSSLAASCGLELKHSATSGMTFFCEWVKL